MAVSFKIVIFTLITAFVFIVPTVLFWYWSTFLERSIVSHSLLEQYSLGKFCNITHLPPDWYNYKITKVYRFGELASAVYKDCEKYERTSISKIFVEVPHDKWYCHKVHLQDPNNDFEDKTVHIDKCIFIDDTSKISENKNAFSDPFFQNNFKKAISVTMIIISVYLCSLLGLKNRKYDTNDDLENNFNNNYNTTSTSTSTSTNSISTI
jgi:hypothetical protein